jgi:tetratricopeptide (TPR) repeat protein
MLDFNLILKIDTANSEALFHKALIEMESKNLADALEDFNRSIALSPSNALIYFNRAILKGELNDFFGAVNDYDKVLSINPNNIQTYFNRAGAKATLGDLHGALKDYDKVIELFPAFTDAYYNRSIIKKELKDFKGSWLDEKRASTLPKINMPLSDSAIFIEKLRMMKLLSLDNDFDANGSADSSLKQNLEIKLLTPFFITLFPDFNKKTYVFDTEGKKNYPGKALAIVNYEENIDKEIAAQKISVLDSLLTISPKDINKYLERALLRSNLQRYSEAFSDIDKCVLLDPNNQFVYFINAAIRYKSVTSLYGNAVDELPADMNELTEAQKFMLTNISNTYNLMFFDLTRSIEIDSGFAFSWYNRGVINMFFSEYQSAISDFTRAVECDKELAEAWYNRGLLLIYMNEPDKGCSDLSKAGELGISEAYESIKKLCFK